MWPILWRHGDFVLYTHDVFTVAGLLAGLTLYYASLRRSRMLGAPIVFVSVAALAGGVIGARLVTSWEVWDQVPAGAVPFTYAITHGPKSIIGGLAGGYVATVLAKKALDYRESTGDHYAIAIPVALVIGRIGCFLSELPLGTPTSLPWGVEVTPEAAAAFPRCPGCDGPMHPSMLYEIGLHVVAAGLIVRYRHLIPVRGDTLKLYLLAYAIFRFGVEFVRGNEPQFAGLTGPQIVLIPLTALLALHFARQLRRGIYSVPRVEPAPAISRAARGAVGPANSE